MAIGGFARNVEGRIIGRAAAEAAWVPAGRDLLGGLASQANATISQSDFADEVQRRGGVHALGQPAGWLAHCLESLALATHAEGIPPLTSLVVQGDGKVGESYAASLAAYGRDTSAGGRDRESQAAADRIECYRWAGAPEPLGGWRARTPSGARTSSTRTPATRTPTPRATKAVVPEREAAYCPSCFMALPATGRCDYCA